MSLGRFIFFHYKHPLLYIKSSFIMGDVLFPEHIFIGQVCDKSKFYSPCRHLVKGFLGQPLAETVERHSMSIISADDRRWKNIVSRMFFWNSGQDKANVCFGINGASPSEVFISQNDSATPGQICARIKTGLIQQNIRSFGYLQSVLGHFSSFFGRSSTYIGSIGSLFCQNKLLVNKPETDQSAYYPQDGSRKISAIKKIGTGIILVLLCWIDWRLLRKITDANSLIAGYGFILLTILMWLPYSFLFCGSVGVE